MARISRIVSLLPFAAVVPAVSIPAAASAASTRNESSATTSSCGCDVSTMIEGERCTVPWNDVRTILRPSQESVGYASVKRKLDKFFRDDDDGGGGSNNKAQEKMDDDVLPFVLGPGDVPYLVDSHHTVSALEASGRWSDVNVTLEMVCDWRRMEDEDAFHRHMAEHNFMQLTGRPRGRKDDLPVMIDPRENIPRTIGGLIDDPWRSLGALVRKVKDKHRCPKGHRKCMRGYVRECDPEARGHMTAFFEYRWSYFFNDAYVRGCEGNDTLWDDREDCIRFGEAYDALPYPTTVEEEDLESWMRVAELLVPLCRGEGAGRYVLPSSLGEPMAGRKLPGYRRGLDYKILEDDPKCKSPECLIHPEADT